MAAGPEEEYESVLCVKPAVLVYRLPPRASNRGYRAAEWQLDQPAWSGRLRITAKGSTAFIKLEDKASGELFAQAPVEQFPGIAVEGVTDSSRYFVIRIEDGNGRRAFIGVGFVDRGDAFDFNVALQDHFKWVRQQSELARQAQDLEQGPKLDLGFKEGQTIKLNIANMKKKEGGTGSTRPRPAGLGGLSLLPPPPGGKSGSGERPAPLSTPAQLPGTPITGRLPTRLRGTLAGFSSDPGLDPPFPTWVLGSSGFCGTKEAAQDTSLLPLNPPASKCWNKCWKETATCLKTLHTQGLDRGRARRLLLWEKPSGPSLSLMRRESSEPPQ
uniref:Adaptin ear-binding coat-associated protein 2 n=1 Tax=Taeniopygia guttata TaxID=59729 RepID=A0A674GVG3_TAEGU